MDRDVETIDRNLAERSAVDRDASPRELGTRQASSRQRSSVVGRDHAYQLSPRELETMGDIGRFRTVATEDLASQRYPGRATDMPRDLRSLIDQGLVQRRSVWTRAGRAKLTVVVLSTRGKE